MWEFEVNHATGKVVGIGQTPRDIKLVAYDQQRRIYALHVKGHVYFGGQSQPQIYAGAEIVIYEADDVTPLDNQRERFTARRKLLCWEVCDHTRKLITKEPHQ